MSILTDELLASFESSIDTFENSDTLPAEIYTSEEFLDFERRALFDHEWLCVGLASEIPRPGDWFTKTVNGEPVIVVRGKDGEVRALSAVCQHTVLCRSARAPAMTPNSPAPTTIGATASMGASLVRQPWNGLGTSTNRTGGCRG